jgi:hypothetical protein
MKSLSHGRFLLIGQIKTADSFIILNFGLAINITAELTIPDSMVLGSGFFRMI